MKITTKGQVTTPQEIRKRLVGLGASPSEPAMMVLERRLTPSSRHLGAQGGAPGQPSVRTPPNALT